MEKTGILVMAYGGPDSLEDVEPYLLDVRGGRPTSPHLVEEIRERYARIGGRSPLLEITRQQAMAVENELNRRWSGECAFKAYLGMRHWSPRISQAVADMKADGIRKAVAVVMAPHYSRMSIELYLKKLDEALKEHDAEIDIHPVRAWFDHPGLIAAISERVEAAIKEFEGSPPYVLFTAHSLPSRILAQGDPYPQQLQATARLVASNLELEDGGWSFCYQSAGRTGEEWLGPQIENYVPELIREGEKNILVVPVGFVSDHVEVLYDIDVEVRDLAQEMGARLERSRSLNVSETFINSLADLVEEHLKISDPRVGE
jgi:protoporphyrin/coproporphyrin ferrochelatase